MIVLSRMDIDSYLKAMISVMIYKESSLFAVLCKTREETVFVKTKFLELYATIPDWLKPVIIENRDMSIRIGNSNQLLFLTNDRGLQGRTLNHVALIVKSNDYRVPEHAMRFLEAGKLTKIYLS